MLGFPNMDLMILANVSGISPVVELANGKQVGNVRVIALLQALCTFMLLPQGFRNA
uniref:Uncharacterized protein n=1 Tax=Candidatus Kentrum sp. TUN TaxID=2126343 RepID=A0A450ZK92_9GAMM|nr:MAG: hypothetical protein BECKTUN1418D_GA0071000_102020 [Candidatus Kentron sp. TUN]